MILLTDKVDIANDDEQEKIKNKFYLSDKHHGALNSG